MTREETIQRYSDFTPAECPEGLYRVTGRTEPIEAALPGDIGPLQVEVAEAEIKGWPGDHVLYIQPEGERGWHGFATLRK